MRAFFEPLGGLEPPIISNFEFIQPYANALCALKP